MCGCRVASCQEARAEEWFAWLLMLLWMCQAVYKIIGMRLDEWNAKQAVQEARASMVGRVNTSILYTLADSRVCLAGLCGIWRGHSCEGLQYAYDHPFRADLEDVASKELTEVVSAAPQTSECASIQCFSSIGGEFCIERRIGVDL
eukprot:1227308-Amphidinium_carterae.1